MDRYIRRFLGRRRGWLLTTQLALLIAIAAMGFLEPATQLLDGGVGCGCAFFRIAGYRL